MCLVRGPSATVGRSRGWGQATYQTYVSSLRTCFDLPYPVLTYRTVFMLTSQPGPLSCPFLWRKVHFPVEQGSLSTYMCQFLWTQCGELVVFGTIRYCGGDHPESSSTVPGVGTGGRCGSRCTSRFRFGQGSNLWTYSHRLGGSPTSDLWTYGPNYSCIGQSLVLPLGGPV